MKLKEINLMNVLLCFCVVVIHLTAYPVTSLRHDSIWYFIMFALNKFLSFAVPAFIFLSGFKLYNKYKDTKISLKQFYLDRFTRIIIPYFIAYIIYFAFYIFNNLTNWNDFLPNLLSGNLVAHFYYIIISIQLYLIFPFLNTLFKKFDKILLIVSFISTIIFNQFIFFSYSDRFLGTYALYFILGMFIAKYHNKTKSNIFLYIFLSSYILLTIFHIVLSYMGSIGVFYYKYSGILQVFYVTFATISIYNLCLISKNTFIEKIVNYINNHTFYIFLYHILIINILQFVIYPHFNLSIKYNFIITSLIVFFSIFTYCYLKNKLKIKKSSC